MPVLSRVPVGSTGALLAATRKLCSLHALSSHNAQACNRPIPGVQGGAAQKFFELPILRRDPAAGGLCLARHGDLTGSPRPLLAKVGTLCDGLVHTLTKYVRKVTIFLFIVNS